MQRLVQTRAQTVTNSGHCAQRISAASGEEGPCRSEKQVHLITSPSLRVEAEFDLYLACAMPERASIIINVFIIHCLYLLPTL